MQAEFKGVDAAKRYDVLSYLKKLNRKLGTTMFLITHDMEAALIVDKAAILREGKLLEIDLSNLSDAEKAVKRIRVESEILGTRRTEQAQALTEFNAARTRAL